MTRPQADEAAPRTPGPGVRRSGLRSSLTRSRWGLWLSTLLVATGASLLVSVAGSGGTAALVPSAIQVGAQARTVTSSVVKPNVPTPSISTPSTQPVVAPTAPTTSADTHHTTVIDPVSSVTDQKDSGGGGPLGGGDNSGDSNTGTTANTSTTTTSTATVTSTSVDN